MKEFNYFSVPNGMKTVTLPYSPNDKTVWVIRSDKPSSIQIFGTFGWKIRRYENRIVCTPKSVLWRKLGYMLRFKCGMSQKIDCATIVD